MAANFQELLGKTAASAERPPVPPVGHYVATALRFEVGESSKKKTPFVRIFFRLEGPKDDVDPDLLQAYLQRGPIGAKAYHRDFYMTEDAEFMLREFFEKSLKWDIGNQTYRELLAQLPTNLPTLQVEISHRASDQDPSILFPEIKACLPLEDEAEPQKKKR